LEIIGKESGLTPEMARTAMPRQSYRLLLDAVTIQSLNNTALFLKEQKKIGQRFMSERIRRTGLYRTGRRMRL
jgi:hypothetical protein